MDLKGDYKFEKGILDYHNRLHCDAVFQPNRTSCIDVGL